MTVLVTKRCAKMRAGDLTVKPEPKTGWWIALVMSAHMYIDSNNIELRKKLGSAVLMDYELMGKVKRAGYTKFSKELRTVLFDSTYIVYPPYATSRLEIRSRITKDEYYKQLYVDADSFVDGKPIYYTKHKHLYRVNVYGNKFTRYNSCPAWAAYLEVDTLPVGVAA